MSTAQTFGIISAVVVAGSAIPYGINTYNGNAKPNITSWSLWAVIGFALLVTYRDSGAEANLWPALFGFINPSIIVGIAIYRRNKLEPMTRWEIASIIGCVASLALWYKVLGNKEMAQYALYLAILADLCAAIPTFIFVSVNPHEDRPIPWALFAFGYALGMGAITDHTFSNYILPIYMFVGALAIAGILAKYRVEKNIPIRNWI